MNLNKIENISLIGVVVFTAIYIFWGNSLYGVFDFLNTLMLTLSLLVSIVVFIFKKIKK